MNVFDLRTRVVDGYAAYIASFIAIRDRQGQAEQPSAAARSEGLPKYHSASLQQLPISTINGHMLLQTLQS